MWWTAYAMRIRSLQEDPALSLRFWCFRNKGRGGGARPLRIRIRSSSRCRFLPKQNHRQNWDRGARAYFKRKKSLDFSPICCVRNWKKKRAHRGGKTNILS